MVKYEIEYLVGKTYRYKIVLAESPEQAIKKEYYTKDKYLLRDF